ncbi:MAG: PDZ domain-containing protein [Candidatus Eisenbacteria sp.]|nr:PDZ domain-containing protein [Candidatus Eisenbacteria bacterium]
MVRPAGKHLIASLLAIGAMTCWHSLTITANTFTPSRFGIGAYLGQSDSTSSVTVLECTPNGPAHRAGLLSADTLLALDGTPVDGWQLQQVS